MFCPKAEKRWLTLFNILIVDDEIVAVNALRRRVDWQQYGIADVLTANSVAEAKRVLAEHEVHLLLCDIEMPQGTGLALFEWTRQQYPAIECIFITCHAEFEYIHSALKLGSMDYILKPIDYVELDMILKTAVAKIRQKTDTRLEETLSPSARFAKTLVLASTRQSSRTIIQQAVDYIQAHITDLIGVQDVAAAVHLNSQYLMRLFKKEMQCSIMEFIIKTKIDMARELLTTTDLPVHRIADSIGYADDSYFVKVFRRISGETPSAYRANHRLS